MKNVIFLCAVVFLTIFCVSLAEAYFQAQQTAQQIIGSLNVGAQVLDARGALDLADANMTLRIEEMSAELAGASLSAHEGQGPVNQAKLEEIEQLKKEVEAKRAAYEQMKKKLDAVPAQAPQTNQTLVVTGVIGAIGTLCTIFFSWRTDRRATREQEVKLQQMQLQIQELQIKLDAGASRVVVAGAGTASKLT